MRQHQSLLRAQQVNIARRFGLEAAQAASSDDKIAVAADQLKPSAPSRLTSAAAEDEWVIVGNCWGTTVLPRSELKEFQRGNRDFIAWGVGISALIFLAAMLFG